MSLDEIKRQQEAKLGLDSAGLKRRDILGRVEARFIDFDKRGLPNICAGAKKTLSDNGIQTEYAITDKYREYPNYRGDYTFYGMGKLRIPGTEKEISYCLWKDFDVMDAWGDHILWKVSYSNSEDRTQRDFMALKTSANDPPILITLLPPDPFLSCGGRHKWNQVWSQGTFGWKGEQDNERISQAIVQMLAGEEISGNVRPQEIRKITEKELMDSLRAAYLGSYVLWAIGMIGFFYNWRIPMAASALAGGMCPVMTAAEGYGGYLPHVRWYQRVGGFVMGGAFFPIAQVVRLLSIGSFFTVMRDLDTHE